jgi:hypothetical protein
LSTNQGSETTFISLSLKPNSLGGFASPFIFLVILGSSAEISCGLSVSSAFFISCFNFLISVSLSSWLSED